MAAPVALETWNLTYIEVLNTGSYQDDLGNLMLKTKNAMIAGAGAWAVQRSCGKNGGGSFVAGAADYWTVYSDVVAGTGDHSWIVLSQSGIGAGIEMLLDFSFAQMYYINVFFSRVGFTGGSVSARPTAVDEMGPFYRNWNTNNVQDRSVQILKTASGKCTRLIHSKANLFTGTWLIEEPKNVASWWTDPYIFMIYRVGSTDVMANTIPVIHAVVDGAELLIHATLEGMDLIAGNQWSWMQSQDPGGLWDIFPVGLCNLDYSNRYGKLGEIRDFWFVPPALATGQYYPTDGSRQFVVIDEVLYPWTGVPLVWR